MSKRRRSSSRDPLQVQISVRAKLPRGRKPSASLIQEAIQYRIENGEDHPLFKTRIIRWRNPSRRGGLSTWRQGNQEDAWATLGKFIDASNVDLVSVRRR